MTISGYVWQSKLDEYVTVIKFNDTVKKMETLEQEFNDMIIIVAVAQYI